MWLPQFQRLVPKRYVVAALQFSGMALLFVTRTNLSLAMVQMTSVNYTISGNVTVVTDPDFCWSPQEEGVILSLFSYGYLLAPLGGLFTVKYGGATMFGLCLFGEAISSIVSPLLLHFNMTAYAAVRIFEGVCCALSMAATAETIVRWAPLHERTRTSAFIYCGQYVGSALSYPLSGYLAYVYGWEAIFYATGCVLLVWCGLWLAFVSNRPDTDKFILECEREYLKKVMPSATTEKKLASYPFKTLFSSSSFWALMNEYFSYAWCYSFILNSLPLYITDLHDTNIEDLGFISSIPLISSIIGTVVASVTADYLRTYNILRPATIHRIFIIIGQLTSVVFLLCIGLWANFVESIIGFSLLRFFYAFSECSSNVLPMDMYGPYAGFVKGLANGALGICYIFNPLIMGFMVSDHTRADWNFYFYFLSFFNVWNAIIFSVFGSGEPQSWAMT